MKKDNLSPKEKAELDKMWPKGEEYIISCRPEGMSFQEYKTRQRHMREMEKFRGKFYGFEPTVKNGKIKKETPDSKGSPQGRKEDKQPPVSSQDQASLENGEGTAAKE